MADNERVEKIVLRYQTDQGAIAAARLNIGKVRSAMEFVTHMAKQVDLASGKAGKSIREAFSSRTSATIGQFNAELKKSVDQTIQLRDALVKAGKAKKELSAAQLADERFGAISRDVGVIGDVESSLRGAGVSGLIPDLIGAAEALPRLKVGVQNLPAQLDAAAEALGTNKLGLIGLVGAAGGLTIALQLAQQQFEKTKAAALSDLDARKRALTLIQTGSQEEIKARIEALKAQREINKTLADDAQNTLNGLRQGIANDPTIRLLLGPQLATGLTEVGAALNVGAGELGAAKVNADAANTALNETNTELTLLEQAAAAGAGAVNSQTEALEQMERAIQYVIDQRRFEMDAMQLSTDQIKSRQQSIKDEMALLELEIAARQAQGENTDELIEKWAALGQQEAFLAGTATDMAKARALEAAALEYEKAQIDAVIAAHKKYTGDVTDMETRALEQRAALADRYNEALVNAAETAADAAENAVQNLQQARDDILRNAGADAAEAALAAQLERMDVLIEAGREEARAAREHARDMQRIRVESQRQEADLIASRDFAGLFRLRRDTGFQLQDAQGNFQAEANERRIAIQERLDDLARGYQQEADQRTRQTEQKLAEAQLAFEREQAQIAANLQRAEAKARAGRDADLKALDSKIRSELHLKRQAYEAEIRLAAQASDLRQQAYQREVENARRILTNALAQGSGGSATHPGRQYGGSVARGQTVRVNEVRPESFTTAGKTHDFPRSAGVFQANQAGKVNSRAGGNVQFSQTNNITGANDPQAISRLIDQRTTKLLEKYFNAA